MNANNAKSKIDEKVLKNYEIKLQKMKKENEKLKKKNMHCKFFLI